MIIVANIGDAPIAIARGMRIAQMVVAPVVRAAWREVSSLPETRRGAGGFGSTGTGPAPDPSSAAAEPRVARRRP